MGLLSGCCGFEAVGDGELASLGHSHGSSEHWHLVPWFSLRVTTLVVPPDLFASSISLLC